MFGHKKKFKVILSLILLTQFSLQEVALANKSKLFGCGTFSVANSATVYVGPMYGSGAIPASEADAQMLIPTAGILKNFRVESAAPVNSSAVWTVRKNGSDTSLAVTMTTTEQSNTSDSVTVAAGDLISIKIFGGDPGINTTNRWSLEFQSTVAGETILSFSLPSAVGLPAGARYSGIHQYSGSGPISTTATDVEILMPFAGTIKNLRVLLLTAPGATKSRTFLVSVNGATTGDLTTTISETDTTGSNTTDTVDVSAGDRISIYATSANTPASSLAKFSAVLVPTNPGEFIVPYVISNTDLTTTTTYSQIAGHRSAPNTTEASMACLGFSDFQLKGARAYITVAPGVGTSRIFKLREGGADASNPLTVTISDADQTGSSTGTFTPADYSAINTQYSVTGSPANTRLMMSYIGYMAPASARNKGGDFMPFF